jgi:hypothetical protein
MDHSRIETITITTSRSTIRHNIIVQYVYIICMLYVGLDQMSLVLVVLYVFEITQYKLLLTFCILTFKRYREKYFNIFPYIYILNRGVPKGMVFESGSPIRSVFRLTSRGDSNFFLIQAQNLQVKFLVIFKSGESSIFVVFFFFFF